LRRPRRAAPLPSVVWPSLDEVEAEDLDIEEEEGLAIMLM
jgi:hypothetical protein